MKTSKTTLGALALMALLPIAVVLFRPTPEKIITRRLQNLASIASVRADQSLIQRQLQTERLRDFFSSDVSTTWGNPQAPSLRDRSELLEFLKIARASLVEASVQFEQIEVEVSAERDRAKARLTLVADINSEKQRLDDAVRLTLQKVERQWLITEIEVASTLDLGPFK